MSGEAILAAVGATGGVEDDDNPNIIFTNRIRLNFTTSFTSKDALITGLQAYNLGGAAQDPDEDVPYHLDAHYRFKVNDNLSITPGAFALFNSASNGDTNNTTTVGVIRSTFTFSEIPPIPLFKGGYRRYEFLFRLLVDL